MALLSALLALLTTLHDIVLGLFSRVVVVGGGVTTPTPTNSIYGPNSHPLIGSFIPFYRNRHRLLDWYTDLLSASPTQTFVMRRLGARRTVITSNPDNVEHILKTNFCNYPKGKPFIDILGDLLGCGIFNADGDLWLSQRKLASHEFTARSLRELLFPALESEAHRSLLPFLASACDSGRVVDLQDVLRRFAFDIICKISLGTDLGLVGPSELAHSPFAEAFEVASLVSAQRGSAPMSTIWKAKRALGIGPERRLRTAVNLIHNTVTDIIQQRRKLQGDDQMRSQGNNNMDLLSRLIAGGHSDEAIRDMAISFIMAGRDTTSSALTWLFWLLTRHPDVEHELVQEISKHDKQLGYNELRELRFLEACLYESMRLYPPVAWDSKHAEGRDTLPDGTRVERGDRVTYLPYGMGRMERIWGRDWAEFRPRRWLTATNCKELIRVSAYKYPVFQGGPRTCLGKEMAFVQMKFVAATVLSRMEVRRADGGEGMPKVVPLLTAHMAGGLPVVLAKRKPIGT